MYRKTAKKLLKFIEKSPTAFQAVTEDIKMEKNENVFKNALTKLYRYNYNINIQ